MSTGVILVLLSAAQTALAYSRVAAFQMIFRVGSPALFS